MKKFPPYQMNRSEITRLIQKKITEIPELGPNRVLFENPSKKASFPVCVIYNFQARPQLFKASYALSITVEIWSEGYYETQSLYDKVARKLSEINFTEVSMTPQGKDLITNKQRYGSTFEVGWNAITNSFYVNRS